MKPRPSRASNRGACLALALACSTGCSDTEDDAIVADEPAGSAYLLMHTVSSPEGRQNYVFVVPSLDVGRLDNTQGREFSGSSRAAALGGSVYVSDGESLTIERFDVDANLALVSRGKLSVANLGFAYFGTAPTFINEGKAYLTNDEQIEIVIFDPSTMALITTVNLSELALPGVSTYLDVPIVRGDYAFVPVFNGDEATRKVDPVLKLAILSLTTDEWVGTITDDRCGPGGYASSVMPNGDILLTGDATSGFFEALGDPPAKASCLLRIKAGELVFDPEFYKPMAELTPGYVSGSGFRYVPSLGKAVSWARVEDWDFVDADDWYATTDWSPFLIDPNDWSSERIAAPELRSIGFAGDAKVIDGDLHFGINPADEPSGNALAPLLELSVVQAPLAAGWTVA